MKASIDAADLKRVSTLATHATSRSGPMFARSTLLTVTGGKFTVTATDGDLAMSVALDGGGEDGKAIIPVEMIARVAATANGTIDLVSDGSTLTITDTSSTWRLPTLDPDGFPRVTHADATTPVDAAVVSWVAFAASTDPTRGPIQGIRFADGRVVATDSYRAAFAECDTGIEATIPARAWKAALTVGTETEVGIGDDGAVTIATSGTQWTTRVILDQYPNVTGILNTTRAANRFTVKVPAAPLLDALRATDVVATKGDIPIVSLAFTHTTLTVETRMLGVGEAETVIPVESPVEFAVKFDSRFLRDLITADGRDVVPVSFSEDDPTLKPVMVETGDRTQILMPTR